jgi:Spy/CpxP family protein refolding chaperone
MRVAELPCLVMLLVLVAAAPAVRAETPPAAGAGSAQSSPHSGGTHRLRQEVLGALEALELTPAQRQSIRAIAERYRIRGMDLEQRAADIREQMLGVAPDEASYADAVARSGEAAAALASDAVRLAGELRAEIHAVLTLDQRTRLKERAQVERQRWDDWRSRHAPTG